MLVTVRKEGLKNLFFQEIINIYGQVHFAKMAEKPFYFLFFGEENCTVCPMNKLTVRFLNLYAENLFGP